MRTTMYLTAVLAIAVQVTANGQTKTNSSIPANNSLLPVVKHQSIPVADHDKTLAADEQVVTTRTENATQMIKAFKNRIGDINKQIIELEALKSQVNEEINDFFVQKTSVAAADALGITTIISREELVLGFQQQAEELYKQSAAFRKQAVSQNGTSKKESLSTASLLEAQAIGKQIEASILSGKISQEKFNENNDHIALLMRDYYGKRSKLEMAGDLVFDANRSMRLAIEMREEANTYPGPASRLGAMQNAEEKEFMALSKQNEILNMFSSTVCSN
ncbi:MAG: hypothetical protein K0S33_38 [Bacteroidetes bacterium]|nr:hypothetical protein [Bacteroidota bacterium]